MPKKSPSKINTLEEIMILMRKYKINYTKTKDYELTINAEMHHSTPHNVEIQAIGFQTDNQDYYDDEED